MRDIKTVAGAVLALLLIQGLAQHAWAQEPQKLLLDGDMALWTVAVKPDKTAQFEQVLAKLQTAFQTSENPERRRQSKHWRVMRMATPLPDGNVGYVHMVSAPVPGADYTVMRILYEAFPDQARAIYDLYMGSFAANVSLATGTIVAEMSTAP